MKKSLDKTLFFSMTMDFLTVYVPQDSASAKTVKSYRDGLTVFRRYLTNERHCSILKFTFSQCTFDLVLEYRNWLLDVQKQEKSTINNRLSAVKSYLRYAAAKDITLQQVHLNVAEVPYFKVPKKLRPVIENETTVKALLDAPPNTRTGCRDVMILSVLFDTMIRADELIRLNVGDLSTDTEIPYLKIHGKGNKERMAPLSTATMPLIHAYVSEYHDAHPAKNTPYIYTIQHGVMNRMSERNVERIVKKYADQIRKDYPDLPDTVYPHMLRRTRGTGLYRDGVAIEAIATAMGHASIQTTKDHYAFPSLSQKKEIIECGGVIAADQEQQIWPEDESELAAICANSASTEHSFR